MGLVPMALSDDDDSDDERDGGRGDPDEEVPLLHSVLPPETNGGTQRKAGAMYACGTPLAKRACMPGMEARVTCRD